MQHDVLVKEGRPEDGRSELGRPDESPAGLILPSGPTSAEWWRGAVIYQIYPRSFADTDGDGVGDLPGITRHLDHVAALGADAIWISPFFRSPMKDYGYDVSDYCAVDPIFGTLEDFDRLVARAHALGLRVLIDQVWSHSSDEHPWFRESRAEPSGPRADWYVWAPPKADGTPPNNWLSVFGGPAWTWDPVRRNYYLHHFLSSQPQLNLRNPDVVEALLETGRFWLERGVDGFRMDAVDFLMHEPTLRPNPPRPTADGQMPIRPFRLQWHYYDMMHPDVLHFLGRVRDFLDQWPDRAGLGEISSEDGALGRIGTYTGGSGDRLHMAYSLRLMRKDFSREILLDAIREAESALADGWICWAFGNHDVERMASRWGGETPAPGFLRLLMALLLSLRGSICLYQGDELGLTEAKLDYADIADPYGKAFFPVFKGRDGCRTPMPWNSTGPAAGFSDGSPWLPVPEEHRALAVDRQGQDPSSLLAAYRTFLAWRKRHEPLVAGSITLVETAEPLVAFERILGADRLLCVFNLSDQPVSLDRTELAVAQELTGHGFEHPTGSIAPHGAWFARV